MKNLYPKFEGKYTYKASLYLAQIICDVFARIDISGYENVPDGPCIVAANHVSYLDPFSMGFIDEREFSVVARDTLMKNALAKKILTSLNAIPIKRGQSNNLGVFREMLSQIKAGRSIIIFPEGTRSADGSLQRGKAGVGFLALKAGVPILPVRTFGFEDVLPRSGKLGGGVRIDMAIGKPISPAEIDPGRDDPDRAQKAVDAIMQRIGVLQKPRFNQL